MLLTTQFSVLLSEYSNVQAARTWNLTCMLLYEQQLKLIYSTSVLRIKVKHDALQIKKHYSSRAHHSPATLQFPWRQIPQIAVPLGTGQKQNKFQGHGLLWVLQKLECLIWLPRRLVACRRMQGGKLSCITN